MEANEMEPGAWDECGQALHELQGRHHDMGCAIAIGCLQREHHLPGTVECQPLVGHGGAGDIPAQVFEFLPLMGGAAHLGMEAKALCADTVLFCGQHLLAGDGLQAQHLLARPGPKRNAVVLLLISNARNLVSMFFEPSAHFVIGPGPFNWLGIPVIVFGPCRHEVLNEFIPTVP